MHRISGVDLSLVDGFGVSLAQTVIMEVGTDMSKFPDEKHFCSWLGLAPKHEISGGKVLKNKTFFLICFCLKPIALRSGVDGTPSVNQINNAEHKPAFTVSRCYHTKTP